MILSLFLEFHSRQQQQRRRALHTYHYMAAAGEGTSLDLISSFPPDRSLTKATSKIRVRFHFPETIVSQLWWNQNSLHFCFYTI